MNKSFLLILSFIFAFSANDAFSQVGSQRLKNEQKKLEKQISETKTLLERSKKETLISLEEVRLIDRQIEYRESLLRNFNNQIRSSELKIEEKEGRIQELNNEIAQLKNQYAKLLLLAYKKRDKYGDLMYIFSAKSVEEALKRKLYLDKLKEIQTRQMQLIQQNQILLSEEIDQLEIEKKHQLLLAEQKQKEHQEILKTRKLKEEIYEKLKRQEDELLKQLQEQEKNREHLRQEIAKAIQREIAEEQARIEKARREAEAARKKAEEEARKRGESTASKPKPTTPEATPDYLKETAESKLIGQSFASNKGRLPWPVSTGTITLNYGKSKHPTLPNVFINNNGIDISTSLNANVMAIFKGEVTTIMNIPGAGKVVIIKHGDFRTAYSNLKDVYVKKGSIVDTKTIIGSLLPNTAGNVSVAHFEVHQIQNGNVVQLNPNLWLAK